DFFTLELTNKSMRSKVTTYYLLITKQFNEKNAKAIKRLFFSMYYNSFVIFNAKDEYSNTTKEETETEKKVVTTNLNNTIIMDNSLFSQHSNENNLFAHNKLIKDIIIKEDRLFIL